MGLCGSLSDLDDGRHAADVGGAALLGIRYPDAVPLYHGICSSSLKCITASSRFPAMRFERSATIQRGEETVAPHMCIMTACLRHRQRKRKEHVCTSRI